jgi:hypothetical protein
MANTSTRPDLCGVGARSGAVRGHHARRGAVSRQMPCPLCAPHERHLLPCDAMGCGCHDVPIPGITR